MAAQNRRRSSGPATGGRPGDGNGARLDRSERRFRMLIATSFVKVLRQPLESALDDFYLLPEYHRRGLGTKILRHCLSVADAMSLPVRLRYLKWNPVGSLYRRNGFREIGETDIHFLMERQPAL